MENSQAVVTGICFVSFFSNVFSVPKSTLTKHNSKILLHRQNGGDKFIQKCSTWAFGRVNSYGIACPRPPYHVPTSSDLVAGDHVEQFVDKDSD